MDYRFIKTDYLDMVTGGDEGLTKELVEMFREQVAEMYDEMKTHLENKNYRALGDLAHKAKSSVAIMGMDSLAEMLKSFELNARDEKDPELYDSYVSRFVSDTKNALTELDDLISKQ